MKNEEIVSYWVESAATDFSAMENLHANGHHAWALFLGHLVLEKLLKAGIMKSGSTEVPRTHDLLTLAGLAGLELKEERKDFLDDVTTFNLKARYPDYKLRFYRKATREFAERYMVGIREWRLWLLERIKD